jgi:hypothetical protein
MSERRAGPIWTADALHKKCARGVASSEHVVETLYKRWLAVLEAGGDVWVKEGGQSDITADVVRKIKEEASDLDMDKRIHAIQHSKLKRPPLPIRFSARYGVQRLTITRRRTESTSLTRETTRLSEPTVRNRS